MSEAREEQTPTIEERRAPPGLANGIDDAGADDDNVGDVAETKTPTWREDWRTALAGGDENKAKQLQRFSSPENFAKSAFETRERLHSTRSSEPPEEATDVELKVWRKQAGIPETPEGYEIEFPKGIEPTETDMQELSAYQKFMHDKHMTPRAAKAAFEFYMTARRAGAERTAQASEEATIENIADLRKAYPGREYKRNIGLANDFINAHFAGPDAQEQLNKMLEAKLTNGVQLTNYAPFVQMVVSMARAAASADDLISGDVGGGVRSVDEEFKELGAKPKLTEAERARMMQLAEARIKREERGAR